MTGASRTACILYLLLTALFLWPCPAGALEMEMGGRGIGDPFDMKRARRPRPGEWLEYRVAFPVDPLEYSLGGDQKGIVGDGEETDNDAGTTLEGDDGYLFYVPSFEPKVRWRVEPLRIEVREVDENGCNVFMTFMGAGNLFRISGEGGGGAEFYYGGDGGNSQRRRVKIMGYDFEVEEVRREGDRYGFVRWSNNEIPFGVVRFATVDMDLLLLGMGMGRPPSFPLDSRDEVTPELGQLYSTKSP